MKQIALLMLLLFTTKVYSAEPDLEKVKTLFEHSARSSHAAEQLLKLLSPIDSSSAAILICYKGAAEMMQAKYGYNPINKLRRFKKGKKLIEDAVRKEPENIEIRFLRFAIQTNLPPFLNYRSDIEKDKTHLLANLKEIKDKKLKQTISQYLSVSKYCTIEDKARLII